MQANSLRHLTQSYHRFKINTGISRCLIQIIKFTWKLSIIAAMLVTYSSVTILFIVWKANSTIASSLSDAAVRYNFKMSIYSNMTISKYQYNLLPSRKTQKMFFHPDLILSDWLWTIWVTQRTTMSRIVGDRLRFMMCSNGLRKSFWNRKFASSPFSMNFIASCRSESTAKKAMFSLLLVPTLLK